MTTPLVPERSGLARAVAHLRAAMDARPRRAPVPAAVCGLEDASDTLRCDSPAGHAGAHVDGRTGRGFEDTLAECIGDAGAYYRDAQGRPVPIGDAF